VASVTDILLLLSPFATLILWIVMMIVIYLAERRARRRNREQVLKQFPIRERKMWE
jgi:ABC-type Co2+ transport system permease subunit